MTLLVLAHKPDVGLRIINEEPFSSKVSRFRVCLRVKPTYKRFLYKVSQNSNEFKIIQIKLIINA